MKNPYRGDGYLNLTVATEDAYWFVGHDVCASEVGSIVVIEGVERFILVQCDGQCVPATVRTKTRWQRRRHRQRNRSGKKGRGEGDTLTGRQRTCQRQANKGKKENEKTRERG